MVINQQATSSVDVLWPVFIAAASGLGIVVLAFGAALVIAQRRMTGLQRESTEKSSERSTTMTKGGVFNLKTAIEGPLKRLLQNLRRKVSSLLSFRPFAATKGTQSMTAGCFGFASYARV